MKTELTTDWNCWEIADELNEAFSQGQLTFVSGRKIVSCFGSALPLPGRTARSQ